MWPLTLVLICLNDYLVYGLITHLRVAIVG